jgi:hypothetical protein
MQADRLNLHSGRTMELMKGPDPLSDLIEPNGHLFELNIEPASKPAVRANLQIIFRQATLFMAFELPDDAEPAAIFKA